MVTNYGFKLKFKTVVSDYGFVHFKKHSKSCKKREKKIFDYVDAYVVEKH